MNFTGSKMIKKGQKMRDSFVFYKSFYEAIANLSDKKRLKMFDAITEFALNDVEIENLDGICEKLFILIKPQITANNKRFEDGRKGGRPAKNKTSGFLENKTNGFSEKKPNVNVNVNENVNEKEKDKSFSFYKGKEKEFLKTFKKCHEAIFGTIPILSDVECEMAGKYCSQVPETMLLDILYTLKNLKFDTDINFKPRVNWLLKGNNFARLVNGEFGKLKHLKTERELEVEQQKLKQQNEPDEFTLKIEAVSSKSEALDLIAEFYQGKKPTAINGKLVIPPPLISLMKKFDITNKEIIAVCQD